MAVTDWTNEVGTLLTEQDRLNREAQFSLGAHELITPSLKRGFVSSVESLEPISMAGKPLPEGVKLFEVSVTDPFVDADPVAYALVSKHVGRLEQMIRREGFDPLVERLKEHPYMKEGEVAGNQGSNKFTQAWLSSPNLAALKAWHTNVPTAEALGYLTDPCVDCSIFDKDGMQFRSTPETAAFLRHVDDAVAIRDRGTAMQEIATNILSARNPGSSVRWLSLASGTGEPSIAASKHAADINGLNIDLVVADLNPQSLEFVKGIAAQYDFVDNVTTVPGNILAPDFAAKLAKKTDDARKFHVVENMGFEEYLPQRGDELGAFLDMGLPQASDFTRMAYDMVEDGGSLISGNMVFDRPQRDFVFGVVDWPIINARSEESILRIYEEAGIPMDRVKVYRVRNETTGAHVYNIVEVTKPLVTQDTLHKSAGKTALMAA